MRGSDRIRIAAVLAGLLCIGGGVYALTTEVAEVVAPLTWAAGAYFIGKGIFVAAMLFDAAEKRDWRERG